MTARTKAPRVAIATLGCKVNQYDSATLETRLRAGGWEVVPFGAGADAYVINSCSVTDRADAESRRTARRARRLAPSARVVMTGCFAQTNPEAAAIPEVDAVVGMNRTEDLLAALAGEIGGGAVRVDNLRKASAVDVLGAETFGGQTRAFLKVQEGCDLFCTFCIVPFARGRSRSVPPRRVLAELERLARLGYREVVITGVHLGGYGEDLDPRLDLADLVEMLAENPPVPRIRLSSIDPPEITARLLRLVRQSDALCPHFHVPVQAGDDATLSRMRRRYSAGLASEVLSAIREEIPEAGVGTDVIAGFPGETDDEFERTIDFVGRMPFTYLHVFPYSPRRGTTAAKRSDRLPSAIVAERARRLRSIDARLRAAFTASMIGKRASVLVEGEADEAADSSGYTPNYLRVRVPGARANEIVDVELHRGDDGLAIGCRLS